MDERELKDRYAKMMQRIKPSPELNKRAVSYAIENLKPIDAEIGGEKCETADEALASAG